MSDLGRQGQSDRRADGLRAVSLCLPICWFMTQRLCSGLQEAALSMASPFCWYSPHTDIWQDRGCK